MLRLSVIILVLFAHAHKLICVFLRVLEIYIYMTPVLYYNRYEFHNLIIHLLAGIELPG